MQRGMEAERLAVYFEEVGAYEYQQYKKHEQTTNNSPDEVTEFIMEDQPGEVWEEDE